MPLMVLVDGDGEVGILETVESVGEDPSLQDGGNPYPWGLDDKSGPELQVDHWFHLTTLLWY